LEPWKIENWDCANYLDDTLDQWFKLFKKMGLDIGIVILTPDMELLDVKEFRKAPKVTLGSPLKEVVFGSKIVNVDGEVVLKGSERDDRWGPGGTEVVKKKRSRS
jgi:hypothetical protein